MSEAKRDFYGDLVGPDRQQAGVSAIRPASDHQMLCEIWDALLATAPPASLREDLALVIAQIKSVIGRCVDEEPYPEIRARLVEVVRKIYALIPEINATAPPEQAAQRQPCDCKQLCEKLSNPLPPGRFCMAEAAQEKMRAEQIIEIDEDGKVHGDISGLKPEQGAQEVSAWPHKMPCDCVIHREQPQPASDGALDAKLTDLTHTRSCPLLNPMSMEFCTCGLEWRIKLRTEMEMHNAWRKRAEEAEAALAAHDQKVRAALQNLLDACLAADANEELSEFIDGSLLDAAREALAAPAASKPEAGKREMED